MFVRPWIFTPLDRIVNRIDIVKMGHSTMLKLPMKHNLGCLIQGKILIGGGWGGKVGDHTTPINPKAKMLNRALVLLNFVGFLPA